MIIDFIKMHGCGNDFVILDERAHKLGLTQDQAILIADRNSSSTSLSPRSIWATSNGSITDWKGNQVWGDNHAEFVTSSTGLTTKYLTQTNTVDSLFSQGAVAGDNTDSAYFGYTSNNY